MKKVLLAFLLCCGGVFAYAEGPFGVVPDFEEGDNYRKYALHKIMFNLPILYHITEDTEEKPLQSVDAISSGSVEVIKVDADAKQAVVSAVNEWTQAVTYFIKQSKREKEFADIMPILERPVKMVRAAWKENADIAFHFTSIKQIQDTCGDYAIGCFSPEKSEILAPHVGYIFTAGITKNGGPVTVHGLLVHEIGHFFALSDEYYNPFFDNKKFLKTPWRLEMPDAMMTGQSNKISCDDVDGVIFLMDETYARTHRGVYPERSKKGWQSFCDKTKYREGQVVFRDKDGYNVNTSDL